MGQGEIGRLRFSDVTRRADGAVLVNVTGQHRRSRVVVCRHDWEERLAVIADPEGQNPAGLVGAPWRTDPVTSKGADQQREEATKTSPPPVWWTPIRVRNTWFVWHLDHGTPVAVLLAAGGLTSAESIQRLLPYVAEVEMDTAQRYQRGSA